MAFLKKELVLAAFLILQEIPCSASSEPQTHGEYSYQAPRPLDFARHILPNNRDFFRGLIRRESLLPIGLVTLSTGLLIWKDQEIVNEAQRFGRRQRISQDHDQTGRHGVKIGSTRLEFAFPENWGQAMYFLGDGWLHFGIAGGFLTTGLIRDDNRAMQTASQMAESIFSSGLVVQVLKHVTGRESPYTAEIDGGRWRFFPNQVDYHRNVAKHDAFPSGHLAAATASVTVIGSNYPEYWLIRPIGYTLLGVLSYQMMNNGVHWAGDYPLALALGYSFGKISVNRGQKAAQGDAQDKQTWSFGPMVSSQAVGMNVRVQF